MLCSRFNGFDSSRVGDDAGVERRLFVPFLWLEAARVEFSLLWLLGDDDGLLKNPLPMELGVRPVASF